MTDNLLASLSSEDVRKLGELYSAINTSKRKNLVPIPENAQINDDMISEHRYEKFIEYLERLEDYLDDNEITDSEDIKGAIIRSTSGKIRADVEKRFVELKELGKDSDYSFDDFKTEFIRNYLDETIQNDLMAKWYSFKMRPNDNVSNYSSKFNKLTKRVMYLEPSLAEEHHMKLKFIQGLTENLVYEVRLRNPKTYTEALQAAILIEQNQKAQLNYKQSKRNSYSFNSKNTNYNSNKSGFASNSFGNKSNNLNANGHNIYGSNKSNNSSSFEQLTPEIPRDINIDKTISAKERNNLKGFGQVKNSNYVTTDIKQTLMNNKDIPNEMNAVHPNFTNEISTGRFKMDYNIRSSLEGTIMSLEMSHDQHSNLRYGVEAIETIKQNESITSSRSSSSVAEIIEMQTRMVKFVTKQHTLPN